MNTPVSPFEAHVAADSADDNAVYLLSADTGLSKERIKDAMRKGAVWITRDQHSQRLRRAKRALKPGDEIHLYYNETVLNEVPPKPTLIADVGGYTVWYKPSGLRSQGSKWGNHCTVMRYAEQHLEPERTSYTVHRLDLPASGLIMVAHSKTVAAQLAALFQNRQIEKHYLAVVAGDASELESPTRIEHPIDGKPAASEITLLAVTEDGEDSLVNVRIETGRKHQIRRHLAVLGHPIRGDRMYGSGEEDGVDLQLTAWRLAFHCPVQDKPVEYLLPEEFLPAL